LVQTLFQILDMRALGRGLHSLGAAVENFFENGVFTFEIVIEGGFGDLTGFRYLGHAGFFDSLRREKVPGVG
jgi:hypothetical protein